MERLRYTTLLTRETTAAQVSGEKTASQRAVAVSDVPDSPANSFTSSRSGRVSIAREVEELGRHEELDRELVGLRFVATGVVSAQVRLRAGVVLVRPFVELMVAELVSDDPSLSRLPAVGVIDHDEDRGSSAYQVPLLAAQREWLVNTPKCAATISKSIGQVW